MTEVDYSPGAYAAYMRSQQRVANWADDTGAQAHKYKNPFLPRSEAEFRGNDFYRSTSRESSRNSSRTGSRSSSTSKSKPARPGVRSPLRSHTIAVSPEDSISQVGLSQSHSRQHSHSHRTSSSRTSHTRRARSHSPSSKHRSSSGRHHRSETVAYVVNPVQPTPYAGYAYGQGQAHYVQGGYYQQPQQQQPQPAAYVISRGKVQVVYPQQAQQQPAYAASPYASHTPSPSREQHGGFFSRIFRSSKSSATGSRRSRSMDPSRR